MMFKLGIFFLFLLSTLTAIEIVEDKATLPLLNPTFDSRQTAKIILDNGLQLYIISDPLATQSAVAVAVNVGSWQDPKEYPGMAHFLEHMLFMGNAAYPEEDGFFKYTADHGGIANAYTTTDRTVYMFSTNNDCLDEALDRFSHFFIDPLFNPSGIGRELLAVDQEHSKNIENDNWRQWMVFKETGNPDHPNVLFSTGNAETLKDIPQEALKKWYQEHYSANLMHVVVYSSKPLEELKALAIKDFSLVKNQNLTPFAIHLPLLSSSQKGHILYLKPIKDIRTLSIGWELPEEFSKDKDTKAARLLALALSHRGETSLYQELKRQGIAEDVTAQIDKVSSEQHIFSIDISLTTEGVRKIHSAIEHSFQAIARLKKESVSLALFEEMQKMSIVNYQYQTRCEPFHYVSELAHAMIDEDLATFPEKSYVPTLYQASIVEKLIQKLTIQDCFCVVSADPELTSISPDKKEKWMEAEYALKELPIALTTLCDSIHPHPQITLPPSNPFIPKTLSLNPSTSQKSPLTIAEEEGALIYALSDDSYKSPEICWSFYIKSPKIDGSPKATVLVELYLRSLEEILSPITSFARLGGLYMNTSYENLKLNVSINGYSEKAEHFLSHIIPTLKKVIPSEKEFSIYKESLLLEYENASKDLPLFQAMELLSNLLFNDDPTSDQKASAVKEISYEEFSAFSRDLLQEVYIEAMLFGNMNMQQANDVWTLVKRTLEAKAYPSFKHHRKEILILPSKEGPFMLFEKTDRLGNATVLLIEEGSFSFPKKAAAQILGKALHEAFFSTLRTKQQTGYIAKSSDKDIEGQLLRVFFVQSATHRPDDLIARFEVFLEDYVKDFSSYLPEERFETIKKMLVELLKQPPKNMQEKADRLELYAFTYNGDFDWNEKTIQAIEELKYSQFKEYAISSISRANLKRLAILMEGITPTDKEFRYEIVDQNEIKERGSYISWKK